MLKEIINSFFILVLISQLNSSLLGQPNIGIGTSNPNESAVLELFSENQGFLIPRLTGQQINNIEDPANGLMIYNTETSTIQIYNTELTRWDKMEIENRIDSFNISGFSFLPIDDSVLFTNNVGGFRSSINGQLFTTIIVPTEFCVDGIDVVFRDTDPIADLELFILDFYNGNYYGDAKYENINTPIYQRRSVAISPPGCSNKQTITIQWQASDGSNIGSNDIGIIEVIIKYHKE